MMDMLLVGASSLVFGLVIGAVWMYHFLAGGKVKPSATDMIHAWRAECAQHEKGSVH